MIKANMQNALVKRPPPKNVNDLNMLVKLSFIYGAIIL